MRTYAYPSSYSRKVTAIFPQCICKHTAFFLNFCHGAYIRSMLGAACCKVVLFLWPLRSVHAAIAVIVLQLKGMPHSMADEMPHSMANEMQKAKQPNSGIPPHVSEWLSLIISKHTYIDDNIDNIE